MTYVAASVSLVVGTVGTVVGLALRGRLAPADYRYDDEQGLPHRALWWVPVVTGIGSAAFWLVLAPGRPAVVPLFYVSSLYVMVTLAAIDLDVHRLPDAIQLRAYPALALLLAGCSWATGDWGAYVRGVVAGLATFALFLVLALIAPGGAAGGGLGYGDVKLSGLLGALLGWLGWNQARLGVLATFLLGGVIALAVLATRRGGRHSAFAYGPSMVIGTCLAVLTS